MAVWSHFFALHNSGDTWYSVWGVECGHPRFLVFIVLQQALAGGLPRQVVFYSFLEREGWESWMAGLNIERLDLMLWFLFFFVVRGERQFHLDGWFCCYSVPVTD